MKTLSIAIIAAMSIFSCCTLDNKDIDNTKNDSIKIESTANYEISLNDSFQLELASNPTTGYSWNWTNRQSTSIVDTISCSYIADNVELVGSGGKEIWKFKGKKVGIDTIKLAYNRPWESNSTINTKTIFVKVKE